MANLVKMERTLIMPSRADMVYVFWTCRDTCEAKKIIHELLHRRLIACASILPEVESIYRWEDKIEESKEIKIVLKTLAKHFNDIQNIITMQCSYEVPEILQVNISQGSASYISWVIHETTCNLE